MTKDKRLQIRVTDQELDGIKRRAKAAGMSVADFGRKRLLADDLQEVEEQEPLSLDVIENGNLEGDDSLPPEDKARLATEHGVEFSDWIPTIESRIPESVAEAADEPELEVCGVTDLPAGVRCIECGRVHGS